jgi:hypothetical protein
MRFDIRDSFKEFSVLLCSLMVLGFDIRDSLKEFFVLLCSLIFKFLTPGGYGIAYLSLSVKDLRGMEISK